MAQTIQVKNAIDALKRAGFARSEFAVRVERIYRNVDGEKFYEYGDALVSLRADVDKEVVRIPQLLEYFGVQLHFDANAKHVFVVVLTRYSERGRLTVCSTTDGRRLSFAYARIAEEPDVVAQYVVKAQQILAAREAEQEEWRAHRRSCEPSASSSF
jgi:hypothetical protein